MTVTGISASFVIPLWDWKTIPPGHPQRIGAWIDGTFSWLDDARWTVEMGYSDHTLKAFIRYSADEFRLTINFDDTVDFHEYLLVRKITVVNTGETRMKVKLFFHHDLNIYGTEVGDTACYKPDAAGLLHYKGNRYFLINALHEDGSGFAQYATGKKDSSRSFGTWMDAEDGELSGNPIAQGAVDSVACIEFSVNADEQSSAWYWIGVGKNWKEVDSIRKRVIERTPQEYQQRTANYWLLWLNKDNPSFLDLPENIIKQYKTSLLILRTNVNDNGAVMAAIDSDILLFNKDTYSYIWPRDGAIVAHSLDLAGYPVPSRNFFSFCAEAIGKNGYFLHKYNPDGSLASSWHSWVNDGSRALPIQEDETALVLWALWEHFLIYRDIEFIKPLYRRLIKSAADFMVDFIDEGTGLPMPSYDLWKSDLGCIHSPSAR